MSSRPSRPLVPKRKAPPSAVDRPVARTKLLALARAARMKARQEDKLKIAGCTWTRKSVCCAKRCCEGYTAAMVQAVRRYVTELTPTDQRIFLGQRLYDNTVLVHGDREQTCRRRFFFEHPTDVLDIYGQPNPAATVADLYPQDEKIQDVCLSMLVFLVGRSKNFITQPTIETRSFHLDPARDREYNSRESPVATFISLWMKETGAHHGIQIPNPVGDHNYVVFPWPTTKEVYQAYRFDVSIKREEHVLRKAANDPRRRQVVVADEDPAVHNDIVRTVAEKILLERTNRDGEKGVSHEEDHLHIAAYSYFMAVWKGDPVLKKTYRLRKYLPFSKCTRCETNRNAREKTKDTAELVRLKKSLKKHLEFVRKERGTYYTRRGAAESNPQDSLSLIIDGADQNKYALPYTCQKSHATDGAWRMKIHTIGVIAHGRGTYCYTCPDHVAQGHNVTIQALHDTLVDIITNEGELPKKLVLQLDNTTKQCKGKYLFGYLGMLVELGVFEKIILSFLPVGHTHEDIDQLFSRISVYLHKHDHYSRFGLEKAIRRAYKGAGGTPPQVTHWDTVADMSAFLTPFLPSAGFPTCTLYHQFRFFRRPGNKKAALQGRYWTTGGYEWQGMPKDDKNLNEVFPKNSPPDLRLQTTRDAFPSTPTRPLSTEDAIKTKAGYKSVSTLYKVPEADCDDLDAIHKLMCREDPIPFHWTVDEIDLVYGSRQEEVAQGSDDDDEDQVDEIQLIPGKTFVMNPGLGECKFWIGKCMQLETKDGDRGMRVNFLELDDQDDEGDVQKELNGARTFAKDEKKTTFSDYD